MTVTDGRHLRGRQRRQQLIDAALTVLARDGLSGFTHRAVAAEAGVAPASVTYHFSGIDELAVSTMLAAADAFVASLRGRVEDDSVAAYAAALADELSAHRGRVVAGYELYLLAARRPALRDAARTWMEAGAEPVLAGADPARRQVFLAVVGSVCLQSLLSERTPTAAEVEARLAHALA